MSRLGGGVSFQVVMCTYCKVTWYQSISLFAQLKWCILCICTPSHLQKPISFFFLVQIYALNWWFGLDIDMRYISIQFMLPLVMWDKSVIWKKCCNSINTCLLLLLRVIFCSYFYGGMYHLNETVIAIRLYIISL